MEQVLAILESGAQVDVQSDAEPIEDGSSPGMLDDPVLLVLEPEPANCLPRRTAMSEWDGLASAARAAAAITKRMTFRIMGRSG